MSSNLGLTHYRNYTTLLWMYPLHCLCCEVEAALLFPFSLHLYQIPKEGDEDKSREFWECEGWVCKLEGIDTPSMLRLMLSAATLTRMLPRLGDDLRWVAKHVVVYLCKLNSWRRNKAFSWWTCKNQMHTSSQWRRSEVLTTADMEEIELEGWLL